MKPGSWYICGFCVTFVYFYVYAINAIRGEINGPRRGHHPQPPYSRSNRKVALTLVIYSVSQSSLDYLGTPFLSYRWMDPKTL